MDEAKKREYLVDFSKHVPDVLLQQLITTQAYQYVSTKSPGSLSCDDDKGNGVEDGGLRAAGKHTIELTENLLITPSVQRFYGAILFVDISGFTMLSQRLDVESLKNHINGYFSRILEIVDRWGGDVVKFAGDAVYVVWPTIQDSHHRQQPRHHGDQRPHIAHLGSNSSHDSKRSNNKPVSTTMRSSSFLSVAQSQNAKESAAEVTDRAVRCGIEIIEQCGELPVFLDTKIQTKKADKSYGVRLSSFVANIANRILARNAAISPDGDGSYNDAIAYLNIHAGVGVGLLAGIDIGAADRWEYFLIGDPLSDVAKAESLAEKGDIVISAAAHALYHPVKAASMSKSFMEPSEAESPSVVGHEGKDTAVRLDRKSVV